MRTLRNHRLLRVAALAALAVLLLCVPAFAAEEGAEAVNSMYGTFWALVPPIIAITLALITRRPTAPSSSACWWAPSSPVSSPPWRPWT